MSSIPTVCFIDDSATMREVIKIAFRRENIDVVTYHDARLALAEIEESKPDIVITDVIMPEKDGYDVCQFIKTHPDLSNTPVVLMSGVVNRAVAEKAFAVKADELLRKPFQPQDLMARVKQLLKIGSAPAPSESEQTSPAMALSNIFDTASPMPPRPAPVAAPRFAAAVANSTPAMAAAAADLLPAATVPAPMPMPAPSPFAAGAPAQPRVAVPPNRTYNGNDTARLRVEILRLEGLVRKLQVELQAEREYAHALEEHVKTLQEVE